MISGGGAFCCQSIYSKADYMTTSQKHANTKTCMNLKWKWRVKLLMDMHLLNELSKMCAQWKVF